jgi:hypothetical protein
MLRDALDAYVRRDTTMAQAVLDQDDELDGLKLPNKRVLSDVEDCRPRRSCIEAFALVPGDELAFFLIPRGETCRRCRADDGEAARPSSANSESVIASCKSSDSGICIMLISLDCPK